MCQRSRDQLRNLEDARERLRALILLALTPPRPRVATRPTRGSKLRRLAEKQRNSQRKRDRSALGD